MARRLAARRGIEASSDAEAVRLLRQRGIDPFDRATMLELVVPQARPSGEAAAQPRAPEDKTPAPSRVRLPRRTTPDHVLALHRQHPAAPVGADDRDRHIWQIQRDLTRRRRRKMAYLIARLAVFILLPTLAAGWYYTRIATPMFATQSEFVIQQADSPAAGGLGGLFSGTGLATS